MIPVLVAGTAGVATASGVMVAAIQALYGMAKSVNEFIDDHIKKMKRSKDNIISRTGHVLEKAKVGFGIGFITPIIIIAVGQLLLGNPLTATIVVATAPLNPVAMTCAAIGAIYYGWNALSANEQDEILKKISKGVEVGAELIRSVVKFVIDTMKSIFSADNIEKLKIYVGAIAAKFGKRLSDITGNFFDKLKDTTFDVIEFIDQTSGKLIDTAEKSIKNLLQKYANNKDAAEEKPSKSPRKASGKLKPATATAQSKPKKPSAK